MSTLISSVRARLSLLPRIVAGLRLRWEQGQSVQRPHAFQASARTAPSGTPAAPSSPLYTHVTHPHEPRNVNQTHQAERTGFNQRLAVFFTRYFGSMGAFYVLVVWMFSWMTLATLSVWLFRLDHYPFQFLLFLSNLVQLFALPVIMVGQNVLSRHAELQADEQFKATMRTLHESDQMARHLSAQDAELLKQTAELLKQTPMIEQVRSVVLELLSLKVGVPVEAAYGMPQPAQQPDPVPAAPSEPRLEAAAASLPARTTRPRRRQPKV